MIKKILPILAFVFTLIHVQAQEKPLTKAMKITKSVKIKKAVYKLDAFDSLNKGVIIIEGNDIVVDFNNAVLKGSNLKKKPDEFFGAAIIIRNSERVTVKNLTAKGYKAALLADNAGSLTLENCNFSYNYRRQLQSTSVKENEADEISYTDNDLLQYGAAIYMNNSDLTIIRNCKVTGGQNALLMKDCNDALIYNNDFSFNSGIGLGMYGCSRNKILYNKLNFNIRGYGQSMAGAGIVLYGQSSDNLFFKNAVAHCSTGFILQSVDQSGGNINVIKDNDFSYAASSGIEMISGNAKILNNRLYESNIGIRGDNSSNNDIGGNRFRNNNIAFTMANGQNNNIHHNIFFQDKEAIKLWGDKQKFSIGDSLQDAGSSNYAIIANSFNSNAVVYNLEQTDKLNIFNNTYADTTIVFQIGSGVANIDSFPNDELLVLLSNDSIITEPYIEKPQEVFKGSGQLAGQKNNIVTEWGPYDFLSPLIRLSNPANTDGTLQFEIKGPKGKWKVKSYRGLDSLSAKTGEMPAVLTAKRKPAPNAEVFIELEYIGEMITTQFGDIILKGKPFIFRFKKG
jgi:hypothetical protein